ncbi:hypothetical protein [Halopseudomonas bauzanensis]|uniref:hypothetical protein n=1 Tax=Halopseudomonas bauzanensis TaxID=653930 RepID=UPI0025537A88|nr:hypothetical protein [Halopseudomonas bauzanensis]
MSLHLWYVGASIVLILMLVLANAVHARREKINIEFVIIRPSQIILLYGLVSYAMGAMFLYSEKVIQVRYIVQSEKWSFLGFWIWFLAIFFSVLFTNIKYKSGDHADSVDLSKGDALFLAVIALAFCALFVGVTLYPILLFSIGLLFVSILGRREVWLPSLGVLVLWALVLFPLAAFSKRNLIFPALVIVLSLARRGLISRAWLIAAIAVILALIIPMSVMRGYGNFQVDTVSEIFSASIEYINHPIFIPALANNTEVLSFYFHGVNSLEMFLESGIVLYGETIAKAVFLGGSVYGFDHGLRTGIDIYTTMYDPQVRAIGGSFPVFVHSELFMNFWLLSIPVFVALLLLLDSVFRRLGGIRNIGVREGGRAGLLLCALFLARGASFDLFLYNGICLFLAISLASIYIRRKRYMNSGI